MPNEMEGQPAASRIVKRLAFDIKARISQVICIKRRPPKKPREPSFWRKDALLVLPLFSSETVASRIPVEIWDKILGYLQGDPETLSATEKVCRGWYPTSHRLREDCDKDVFGSMEAVRPYARYIKTVPKPTRRSEVVQLRGSAAKEQCSQVDSFHACQRSISGLENGHWVRYHRACSCTSPPSIPSLT